MPGGKHIAKIAGPANRFMNVKMGKGLRYNDPVTVQILKEILSGETPTYQTASRMATYLVLKDLIERNDLQHIAVPKTYLISYGDTGAVDDNVAIVVSEKIPAGAEPVTPKNLAKVSSAMIKDFVRAIAVGGLWSSWGDGNLFVDGDKLYIVDLEQPNNSKPSDFFHQSKAKYHSDVWVGIDKLLQLLQHDKAKLAFAVKAIQEDPLLNAPDFSEKTRVNSSIKKYSQ